MLLKQPYLIDNIDELRTHIGELERNGGKKSELWSLIKSSSRSAPLSFGWYVPFVALITREKEDIENARRIIFTYIDKLDPMSFCTGLQYHFWCFAFPHAKISMYFQWLCTIGAFTNDEVEYISEHLISYHFTNFYYGMRTKPEPECVDNQVLSLCLSTTMVGHIFSSGENPSEIAKIMLRDGLRRLPEVIGDMPVSGYSGEGSSYMDCVNGPAIPLAVEVLELITGEKGLLFKEFPPSGACPVKVLRMVAREFMPGGLLLPWDNYGYQFGVRSALAYGAIKTGERLFFDVLEHECNWTYDIGIGWAYDDLVWTLIWWPETRPIDSEDGVNWFEPNVGGTLVSSDKNRYVCQMWDESSPGIPTRAHVNPGALVFNGYGLPISADGSPTPGKPHSFQFDDTWRSVGFLAMNTESRYNYGDGCGGAHSIVLIDGYEGLRAKESYNQLTASGCDKGKSIWCDVTPIYKENFPDISLVLRKTALHCDTFFSIEDVVRATEPHTVSSRFLFRPDAEETNGGVCVTTQEGVKLTLIELLNNSEVAIKPIENHPFKPDGCSVCVDFSTQCTGEQTSLFVAFISNTVETITDITGFTVIPDECGELDFDKAGDLLDASELVLPMKLPAYMEAPLPNHKTWWYRKTIQKPQGKTILTLPAALHNPHLFIDGEELDLSSYEISKELIGPRVTLPERYDNLTKITLVLKTDVSVGHYDGGGDGTVSMTGGMWLCRPVPDEQVVSARYEEGFITVVTDKNTYRSAYELGEFKAGDCNAQ